MNLKQIILTLWLLICSLITITGFSQIPNDLSNYKSSMITDDQLRSYLEQAGKAGLSEAQIEDEVRRRGLPDPEIVILRSRIRDIISANTKNANGSIANEKKGRNDLPASSNPGLITNAPPSARVFGSDLFSNSAIAFEPNLRIPTPPNYKLGPDDQLIIDVFGVNQSQQTQTISPEGAIKLNYVGPLYINGLTVEEAKNRIVSKLQGIYPAIRSGGTKVQVSLGAIRSIKITILGSVVKPGTYTLPSLATLFNALYASGGPDMYGSFRSIELIRNNKVIEKIDIYRFLLSGDQTQDVRLEDRDVIRIPIARTKVQVNGETVRQGIFELLPGETLGKLIDDYSGGLLKTAYTALVKVERITDREKKLIDIPKEKIASFTPQDGDIYTIDKILDRYENAITVTGAIFRPGKYSFQEGMRITDLINKADGLREDVFLDRAILFRLRPDLTKEQIAINLADALQDGKSNVLLKKDDNLVINSISEITDEYSVVIGGSVRKPGSYVYRGGMSLKDLLLQAGGAVDEASLENIDIARRRTHVDPNNPTALLSDVTKFSLDTIALTLNQQDFKLQPFDVVNVKINPFKKPQESVVIEGQVLYPGPYTILTRQERLSSILKRAGEPLIEANLKGATLKRVKEVAQPTKETVSKISLQSKDSSRTLLTSIEKTYDYIAIDLEGALNKPGSEADILLQNSDVITIPRKDEMVSIQGEVLHPVKLSYEPRNLRHYINAAGGFVSSANKNKVFVVYANGKAAKTKKFLFFRSYPTVEPGSQIFVPKFISEEKPRKSAAEVMATVSAVSTMSFLLIYLVNQIK